ncbi:MAG: DMT family transporter [Pseudomonadota bacterium]
MAKATVRQNLFGIGCMILAMAAFAVEDGIIKYLSADLPTGQILILIGLGGTAVFTLWAMAIGAKFKQSELQHPALIIRTLAELVGTCGFVASLALVDISVISAIVQVNPLLVTLGAALFLRETVGLRRWMAIFIGLGGVMIILRPGTAAFDPAYLLTILGVIGLSVRDVATKRIPTGMPTQVMAAIGFAAVIPAGLILLSFGQTWQPVSQTQIAILAAAVCIGVLAYQSIITGTRIGDISAVMPFRYSRLIFGALVGIFMFGEILDKWTIIGSLIIVISGLYAFWRESQAR